MRLLVVVGKWRFRHDRCPVQRLARAMERYDFLCHVARRQARRATCFTFLEPYNQVPFNHQFAKCCLHSHALACHSYLQGQLGMVAHSLDPAASPGRWCSGTPPAHISLCMLRGGRLFSSSKLPESRNIFDGDDDGDGIH